MLREFYIKDKEIGLKDFLVREFSFSYFGYLKQVNANIRLQKKIIDFNTIVHEGDCVQIEYKSIHQNGYLSNLPLRILYEDNDCLVVDKNFGLPTIPSNAHPYDSVYNRLLFYFQHSENSIHFISRLDKETGGLVLVAKNQLAACLFNKSQNTIKKKYIAETNSPLPDKEGIIDLPIQRINGIMRGVRDGGQECQTTYCLISSMNNVYKYEITLLTGRTHQIRVHFSYFGCPLVNDLLYGIKTDEGPMHLLASQLTFVNPITNERINVFSKMKF